MGNEEDGHAVTRSSDGSASTAWGFCLLSDLGRESHSAKSPRGFFFRSPCFWYSDDLLGYTALGDNDTFLVDFNVLFSVIYMAMVFFRVCSLSDEV